MSANLPANLPGATSAIDSVTRQARLLMRERAPALATAARFLPVDQGRDLSVVYAFCWHVTSGHNADPDGHDQWLNDAEATIKGESGDTALASAWLDVAARRGIPTSAATDLIAGARANSGTTRIKDDGELVRFCYRVAGLVALMLVRVLGATDDRALPHAIDLGIAMQLTNIAVDVKKDATFGDVFLPNERLALYSVSADQVTSGSADARAIGRVTYDVLQLAERYYQSADHGMRFLSLRNRVSLITGARMYRLQGRLLRRQNYSPEHSSVRPRLLRRLFCVIRSAIASVSAPFRSVGLYRDHNQWLHRRLTNVPALGDDSSSTRLQSTDSGRT